MTMRRNQIVPGTIVVVDAGDADGFLEGSRGNRVETWLPGQHLTLVAPNPTIAEWVGNRGVTALVRTSTSRTEWQVLVNDLRRQCSVVALPKGDPNPRPARKTIPKATPKPKPQRRTAWDYILADD